MQLYRKGSEYDETENVGEAEELSPEEEEDETLLPEKRGYRGTQLVLIIQIAACAVVLLAAFGAGLVFAGAKPIRSGKRKLRRI